MSFISSNRFSEDALEFEFTEQDFASIADYASKNFGLFLPAAKMTLVYSRLARRLRILGLTSFKKYFLLLENDKTEKLALLSALTTNVTQFFREPHHFETLRTKLLPELVQRAEAGGRARLWSAGCSTGQEPYSIAMSILDICPHAKELDIKILATDIDPSVVKTAMSGQYKLDEVQTLPQNFQNQFIENPSMDTKMATICKHAKSLISFGTLNLIETLPVKGPFDAIFCRNVAIYFDAETQRSVWSKFEKVMAPGAFLFIGHSERLSGHTAELLEAVGITTYQKPAKNNFQRNEGPK